METTKKGEYKGHTDVGTLRTLSRSGLGPSAECFTAVGR
jgi:hypothetical protein